MRTCTKHHKPGRLANVRDCSALGKYPEDLFFTGILSVVSGLSKSSVGVVETTSAEARAGTFVCLVGFVSVDSVLPFKWQGIWECSY